MDGKDTIVAAPAEVSGGAVVAAAPAVEEKKVRKPSHVSNYFCFCLC